MSSWKLFDDSEEKKKAPPPTASKWYMGKYVGRPVPTHLKENAETIHEDVDEEEAAMHEDRDSDDYTQNNLQKGLLTQGNDPEQDDSYNRERSSSFSSTVTTEETKKEKVFVRVVRNIRNKFVARRLIGNLYIYRVAGFVSTAMRCKIDETYYQSRSLSRSQSFSFNAQGIPTVAAEEENIDDMESSYQRAITMTDSILDSLERRARSWKGCEFNNEVILTRGAKISLTGPFLGIVGYTLLIEISATVESLLESRRRYEMHRANSTASVGGGENRNSLSIARSLSFSFFGNKNNANPTITANNNQGQDSTVTSATLEASANNNHPPPDPTTTTANPTPSLMKEVEPLKEEETDVVDSSHVLI